MSLTKEEIKKLYTNEKIYQSLSNFLVKYWESLTLDDIIMEIHLRYNLKMSKENLQTIRTGLGLVAKGKISASKRNNISIQIPERLARGIFINFYNMKENIPLEDLREKDAEMEAEREEKRRIKLEKYKEDIENGIR